MLRRDAQLMISFATLKQTLHIKITMSLRTRMKVPVQAKKPAQGKEPVQAKMLTPPAKQLREPARGVTPPVAVPELPAPVRKHTMADYLIKPVTEKSKTGQANFLQLASCLLLDMENYKSDIDKLIVMIANIMNFQMHNATHAPAPGYGKAQAEEINAPQMYFRSQQDHPHAKFFRYLTKDQRRVRENGILPRNVPFEKVLLEQDKSKKNIFSNLSRYNQHGYLLPEKEHQAYFTLPLAYSGARANNLTVYQRGLEAAIAGCETEKEKIKTLNEKLTGWLPKKHLHSLPNDLKTIDIQIIQNRINTLKSHFNQIGKNLKSAPTERLLTLIHDIRNDGINNIYQDVSKLGFKNISLNPPNGSSCIYINLYPLFKNAIRDSQNYAEGVTNVIIGFFGGLLNYHAKKRKLYINTNRRQGFGFLRPTLADVGSLSIRLSLGIECKVYQDVISDSLTDLEAILTEFDLTNRKNELVSEGFVVVEKHKGKHVTDKTGNRMLNVMRSDENKCQALKEAQHYLDQSDSISTAFKCYFDKYIVNREAVAFQPDLYDMTDVVIHQKSNDAEYETTLKLLNNVLHYATQFAATLPAVDQASTASHLLRVYYHSLLKLYKNCDKAAGILHEVNEYEKSHLCAKANLLIDNMLEYLIILENITYLSMPQQAVPFDPCRALRNAETSYYQSVYGGGASSAHVYFTDGGEQALTTSILAMDSQCVGKRTNDASTFLQSSVYYELPSFMKEMPNLRTFNLPNASILVTDVTRMDVNEIEKANQLQCIIIDVTNNPFVNHDTNFVNQVKAFREQGKMVILASSLIKHEELGQDKYQAGKIVILTPAGVTLNGNIVNELSSISNAALNPTIAIFLQMINQITREKIMPAAPPCSEISMNSYRC